MLRCKQTPLTDFIYNIINIIYSQNLWKHCVLEDQRGSKEVLLHKRLRFKCGPVKGAVSFRSAACSMTLGLRLSHPVHPHTLSIPRSLTSRRLIWERSYSSLVSSSRILASCLLTRDFSTIDCSWNSSWFWTDWSCVEKRHALHFKAHQQHTFTCSIISAMLFLNIVCSLIFIDRVIF